MRQSRKNESAGSEPLMVFTGNANLRLAEDVVGHLNIRLGRAKVGRFSDGEVMVEILENVRGRDVFVLQSICSPTNDNLMELLVMVDSLKRASAGRVTAAIPYMGYARQDRRPSSARVPISANRLLVLAVALSALLLLGGVYLPGLSTLLGTEPLAGTDLAIAVATAILPALAVELVKAATRWSRWWGSSTASTPSTTATAATSATVTASTDSATTTTSTTSPTGR